MMKWPHIPIRIIAPAKSAKFCFKPNEIVWHLNLDQIEANTGNIIGKKIAPASEAGSSTYCFDKGNVLYSKLRPYLNKVVKSDECGIATTELVPLRPNKKLIDSDYLTYFLRSKPFVAFVSQFVSGAKMPRVIMKKFWEYEIPLPPLSEQHRIVEILNQADVLRKKRTEADKIVERILPSLFYKMFGDPATNPKGWKNGTISDICFLDKKIIDDAAGSGLTYLGLEHIESVTGRIQISEVDGCNIDIRGTTFLFTDQHILYGKLRPYLNKVALPDRAGRCSTELVPMLPQHGFPREYIASFFRLPYVASAAMNTNKGARMPRTDMKIFMSMPTFLPPLEITHQYARIVRKIDDKVQAYINVAQRLETLFAVLNYRAFSGELTAKWCEAYMKELFQEMELQAKDLKS